MVCNYCPNNLRIFACYNLIDLDAIQKQSRFNQSFCKFKLSRSLTWTQKDSKFDELGLSSIFLERNSDSTQVTVAKESESKATGLGLIRVLQQLNSLQLC